MINKEDKPKIKDEKYYEEIIRTLVNKIWELKGQIHGLKKARGRVKEDDGEIPY
jgi:hypothetical protein